MAALDSCWLLVFKFKAAETRPLRPAARRHLRPKTPQYR